MSDPIQHIQSWGGQTIGFAIMLKSQDVGNLVDNARKAKEISEETGRITSDLWEQASNECEADSDVTMIFARKVLDWTAANL